MKTLTKNQLVIRQFAEISPKSVMAILALLFMTFLPYLSAAQGNLLVTPSRIVFDGTTTSEIINLANTGEDTARYIVSFIEYKMTDDGAFVQIEEPEKGQYFASDYVRYFPRNVVLGPKEAQVIKVQTNRTNQLEPGEYRSHLYFRSVPDLKPLGEEEVPDDTTAISVQLTPVFGITIPVIIKVGESTAAVKIADLSLSNKDNNPLLTVSLSRSGNMSVYGNISINYTSPDGKTSQVGLVKGVAVYTPNTLRMIAIPLTFPSDNQPDADGILQVRYSAASDLEESILAETDVKLGQIQ